MSFTSSERQVTLPLPPLSQSFTPLLRCLCSTKALSLSFLHHRQSSCSCADLRALLGLLWASMFTHGSACACFGLKESWSTCIYGTTSYGRYIYIYMKNPLFNSLVWGSLRLAPTIFALSTALYLLYFVLHLQQYYT